MRADNCTSDCDHVGFHYCGAAGTHCDRHCVCACILCSQERVRVAAFRKLSADEQTRALTGDSRAVFEAILKELPADAVVWRSTSETKTAGEMIYEIGTRTDLGRQYASDLLRVCRDLLARKATPRCRHVWHAGIIPGEIPDGARCTLPPHGEERGHVWEVKK